MYEELTQVMQDVVVPERLWTFQDAFRTLSELGNESHEFELQQIFGMQDGISDTDLLVSRVEDMLIVGIGSMTRQYGVIYTDHATLSQMTDILVALASIESFIIPQSLLDIIQGDFTNEEVIAEIVPYFTTLSDTEALDVILEVSDAAITRLHSVVSNNVARQAPELPAQNDHREKTRALNRMIRSSDGQYPAIVQTLAKSGMRLAYPLPDLITSTLEELDALSTDRVATEVVGLVLYSDVPFDKTAEFVNAALDDFTDDYAERTKMKHTARQWQELIQL